MKKLIALHLLLLAILSANGQISTNASGGNAASSNGSESFSVGQVVYSFINDANGLVSQGVQQPYEILATFNSEEFFRIDLKAFPNPAVDMLTLEMKEFDTKKLTYTLTDTQGKILQNKNIISNKTSILMNGLLKGIYFLTISQENVPIKNFKIIKK